MSKDSFLDRIGRSLKLEDEQYEPLPKEASAEKFEPQIEENESDEMDDIIEEGELTEENLYELEELAEELEELPESSEPEEEGLEPSGPITTLAMARTASGTGSAAGKKTKTNKKPAGRAAAKSAPEPEEKNMATKKVTPTNEGEKSAAAEEEVLEEGRLTIDVYETDDNIVIKSTIAGVEPDDLDINITADSVTIRGARHKEDEVSADDYFYQECYWGAFSRSVILPTEIDPDKADATMKNGVLTIELPKLSKAQQKKLSVKAV